MKTEEIHQVIITNEAGMASVYPYFRAMFGDKKASRISLLYFSEEGFLFKRETEILRTANPSVFMVFYQAVNPVEDFLKADLEAVINANTCKVMRFLLSGSEAFNSAMTEVLHFLGIKDISYQKQFFINNG